jgi:ZIP family zinc transporter
VVIAFSQSGPLAVGVAAGMMTYLGGVTTFRVRHRLPLIPAIAAGIVVGVALFDLLPEAIALGVAHYGSQVLFAVVAVGMIFYMAMDRGFAALPSRYAVARRHLAPASLTLHSLMDGLGIGITFHLSSAAGVIMAIGVLTHDVADGMNTVTLSLTANNSLVTHRWLVANSLAPIAGVITGMLIDVGDHALAPLLALFGGAFLYIGACQLIPRGLAANRSPSTALAIAFGMVFIYAVLRFAQP